MNVTTVSTKAGILALAALCGVLAAWRPRWFALAALLATVGLVPLARKFWKLSIPQLAGALLIGIQISYVLCHTWFDVDYVPTFKYLRVPLLLVLPITAVLGGFLRTGRRELTGPLGLALAYILWVVVAGQWGLDPKRTLLLSAVMFLVVMNAGIAVALSDDPAELWGRFLQGLTWLGIASCVACVVAIATGADIVRADRWISGEQRNAYRGIFFNANVMGAQGLVTIGPSSPRGSSSGFLESSFSPVESSWLPLLVAVSSPTQSRSSSICLREEGASVSEAVQRLFSVSY
jgi:hypothetical protein